MYQSADTQRGDQRAGNLAFPRLACLNQPLQGSLYPPQIVQLGTHVRELVLGNFTRIGAMGSVVQPQQQTDFIQGETETLG